MTENTKQAQRQAGALTEIKRLGVSLDALAVMTFTRELYTRAERGRLLAEHKSLVEADNRAHQLMAEAAPHDTLSWEQRVEQFGKAAADEQFAPREAAIEAKMAAGQAVGVFEREHPLIGRFVNAVGTISRSSPA